MLHTSPAPLGTHLILDLWGLTPDLGVEQMREVLIEAAGRAGATILHDSFHDFEGRGDQPGGFTGVLVLAESHISIHTWPEADYAAIDIFMCGDARIDEALEHILGALDPRRHALHRIGRGIRERRI